MQLTHKLSDFVDERRKAGEQVLDVTVPHRFILNLGYAMLELTPGVHQVTETIARHPYAIANKVTAREGKLKPPRIPDPVTANVEWINFLQSKGYAIRVLGEAQKFLDNIPDANVKDALVKEFEQWTTTNIQKPAPVAQPSAAGAKIVADEKKAADRVTAALARKAKKSSNKQAEA